MRWIQVSLPVLIVIKSEGRATYFVVAPIASSPGVVLNTAATLVDDEMSWVASSGQEGCQVLSVDEFVVAHLGLVAKTVIVGDVG